MKKVYHGQWVTRSNISNRNERLAEHEEFLHSELKRKLDEGYKVRRARIKKEKPVFKMWGTVSVKFDIPFEVLVKAGFAK